MDWWKAVTAREIGRSGRRGLGGILAIAVLLVGCGSTNSAAAPSPAKTSSLQRLTVGMGYVQNIQFAPFYVAMARGYYKQAGLAPQFQYAIEPDLLRLASIGKVDLVNAGGDEVLAAAAQGLHVTYVMTQYSRFPTAVFSLASRGIRTPAQLKGHSIGVPGTYGASYVGLLALLNGAGLSTGDVRIENIGFTQAVSVVNHKIDAAVGYATNDVVQARAGGRKINEIDVYKYENLAGAGIAAGNTFLQRHPALVRAFVRATLRGLSDTLKNPRQAFQISLRAVPALRAQSSLQWAVLQRSLTFWRAESGRPLGWVDPQVWRLTARLLYRYHQIPHAVQAGKYYTEQFVSG